MPYSLEGLEDALWEIDPAFAGPRETENEDEYSEIASLICNEAKNGASNALLIARLTSILTSEWGLSADPAAAHSIAVISAWTAGRQE